MSAFLGHIHYWLYRKIRLVAEREQLIYEKAAGLCGDTAEELRSQVWQTYGDPLPDVDLQQLIDQSNIHGWLQRQITIAETREAAFINELLAMCSAQELVAEAFAEHGALCGQHAVAQGTYNTQTADGIHKAVSDYLLNGMPCDQGDAVVVNTAEKVVWESAICLQEKNWEKAGISSKLMKSFYQKWLGGFVKAINPEFAYSQTADSLAGHSTNRYQIAK
jgi:hypothetical protein